MTFAIFVDSKVRISKRFTEQFGGNELNRGAFQKLCKNFGIFEQIESEKMGFVLEDELLEVTKAELKRYYKGDIILSEGDYSDYFYYLKTGELSVSNLTEKGKELLQHKVKSGHFFGEPAVLLGESFPGTVEVCSEQVEIIKIKKEALLDFLKGHPEKLFEFTLSIARKTIKKSELLKQIVLFNPEDRIQLQLHDYKKNCGKTTDKVMVEMTRKEISHMTGLRIETVIRTIKKMEKDGKLEIVNGKIFI